MEGTRELVLPGLCDGSSLQLLMMVVFFSCRRWSISRVVRWVERRGRGGVGGSFHEPSKRTIGRFPVDQTDTHIQ